MSETEPLFVKFLERAFATTLEEVGEAELPTRNRSVVKWDNTGGFEEGSEPYIDWQTVLLRVARKWSALEETENLVKHLYDSYNNGMNLGFENVHFNYLLGPLTCVLSARTPAEWDGETARRCISGVLQYLTTDDLKYQVSTLLANVSYRGSDIELPSNITLRAVGPSADNIPWGVLPYSHIERPVRPSDVHIAASHELPKTVMAGHGQDELFEKTRATLRLLLMVFDEPIVVRSWQYHDVTWIPGLRMSPSTPHPLPADNAGFWTLNDWELKVDSTSFLRSVFTDFLEPMLKAPADLQLAMERYLRSRLETNGTDGSLLELTMALEALLSPGRDELRHRVSQRLAMLIGRTPEARETVFHRTRACYDLRSGIIHGGQLAPHANVQGERIASYDLINELRRSVGHAILASLRLDLSHDERGSILDRAAISADTSNVDARLAGIPQLPWKPGAV